VQERRLQAGRHEKLARPINVFDYESKGHLTHPQNMTIGDDDPQGKERETQYCNKFEPTFVDAKNHADVSSLHNQEDRKKLGARLGVLLEKLKVSLETKDDGALRCYGILHVEGMFHAPSN
jgi:hypothetical protein